MPDAAIPGRQTCCDGFIGAVSSGLNPGKPVATEDPFGSTQSFRDAVAGWFVREGRDFPWRRTSDPYRILVSELMLQQTRVETVLKRGYYERWLERFPDLETLAGAAEDDLLKAWEGLGYYRRARFLQAAARAIVERHGGQFPRDFAAVRALPGVGGYTAGAVMAFAFDEPAAMIDGNVGRVLARLFDYREPVDSGGGRQQLEDWSRRLVDPVNARQFQAGLMELGQTLCSARNPSCVACPVAKFCQTREPGALPVKREGIPIEKVEEWVLWLRDCGGRICLEREQGSRRQGLWRLPKARESRGREVILRLKYAITRYQVTMHVLRATAGDGDGRQEENWHEEAALTRLALAAPDRRAVERLLQRRREGDFWPEGA